MHDLSKGCVVFAVEYSLYYFYIDFSKEKIRKKLLRSHNSAYYKALDELKLIYYCKILFKNGSRKHEIMNKFQS